MFALCTPERINATADLRLHFSPSGTMWAIIHFYETCECVAVPLSRTGETQVLTNPADVSQLC